MGVPPFAAVAQQVDTAGQADVPPVVIDYFYEAGCPDCFRVRDQVMPELKERFEGYYVLNRYDVTARSNVVMLVQYQDRLDIKQNAPVCMVVDYRYVLNGFPTIKTGLLGRVEQCVVARLQPGWQAPQPIAKVDEAAALVSAKRRATGFTLMTVLVSGLLDGINPCSVSTLVFLVSLLMVAKAKPRQVLVVGAIYCIASFLTYFALGFGIFRAVRVFWAFPFLRQGLSWLLACVLGLLAFLSFRDAMRYRRSGSPEQISLRMPEAVQRLVHRLMREEIKTGRLAWAAFVLGILVTVLESVCTGQVYVPTMVYLVKTGEAVKKGLLYLTLYNAAFILPLVVVFLLTYEGMRLDALLAWSRRNVVISKLCLGIFFIALAALTLVG